MNSLKLNSLNIPLKLGSNKLKWASAVWVVLSFAQKQLLKLGHYNAWTVKIIDI